MKAFEIGKYVVELPKDGMSYELTQVLVALCMLEVTNEVKDYEQTPLEKVLEAKAKYFMPQLTLSSNLLTLIAFLCDGNIGVGMLYLCACRYLCEREDTRFLNLEKWCYIFSQGFPVKEGLIKVWDMQKVEQQNYTGSDNSVDYPENWQ